MSYKGKVIVRFGSSVCKSAMAFTFFALDIVHMLAVKNSYIFF